MSPVVRAKRRCLVCDAEAFVSEAEDADVIGAPAPSATRRRNGIEVLRTTRSATVNPHAAALGRLGGLKGGPARAAGLSRERRREIARHAAQKRWGPSRQT